MTTQPRSSASISAMDAPRARPVRRRARRWVVAVIGAAFLCAALFALSKLGEPLPIVDGDTIWIDTVRRGPLVRQVGGRGVLMPAETRWIPAVHAGRVDRILVAAGSEVRPDTLLIRLDEPAMALAVEQAQAELEAAEAEAARLTLRLESDRLAQEAIVAAARADAREAELDHTSKTALARDGLASSLGLELAGVRAEELAERARIEAERLELLKRSAATEQDIQQARIRRLQSALRQRRNARDALDVRAGIGGVLQNLSVEVGQQVASGSNLARVADHTRLRAVFKVDESRARDIQPGLAAEIDILGTSIAATVSHVDPAVEQGFVQVIADLDETPPRGARPDLSVSATIELERVPDTLFVGRPTYAREHGEVDLYRVTPDGRQAERVAVRLGRDSVQRVEIVTGLEEGTRVILSDMSPWQDHDRVRIR